MNNKFLILALIGASLTACSDKNPEEALAKDYMLQVTNAIDGGDYTLAMAWMDSIDKRCPTQIEARKQVTTMRAQAMEQLTLKQIATTDSLIAATQLESEQLEPLMKHIPGDDLEGYYVVADAYKADFINSTGIEPRVNDADFNYYIVAQNKGKAIGIRQITLNTATSEFSSQSLPAGTARLQTVEGGELASFLPEEVAELGAWAADNDVKGAVINGTTGNVPVKLNAKQAASFGTAYRFANSKLRNRQARIVREKLERQLQIARDHQANSMNNE